MDHEQLKAMSREQAEYYLKQYFGLDHFYDDQWTVIKRIFNGERVLAIERTGFGKSLCYQFPAVMFDGVTVIFSPLIALMRDQTKKLTNLNLKVAYVNSSNTPEQNSAIIQDAIRGKYKILYITPERQQSEEWLQAVRELKLSMVVIDEAHTISSWGHDFRPAFQRIISLVKLLPQNFPVLATTATATIKVQNDIAAQITDNNSNSMTIIRGSMMRPNLKLMVLEVESEDDKMLWLADNLMDIPGTGLIYAGTRVQVEQYTAWLNYMNIPAVAYHAGLDSDKRAQLEQGLMQNRWKCIVSTNALGMGIDKSDIRFIIHVQVPASPVHYYQEIGRAGRDNQPAYVVLLFNSARNDDGNYVDSMLQLSFIERSRPSERKYNRVIEILKEQTLKFTSLQEETNLKQDELRQILNDLETQHIIVKSTTGYYESRRGAPSLDLSEFEQLRQSKRQDFQCMLDYIFTDEPRMSFLCHYLDDQNVDYTTNCDNTNLTKQSVPTDPRLRQNLKQFLLSYNPPLELAKSFYVNKTDKVRFLTPTLYEYKYLRNDEYLEHTYHTSNSSSLNQFLDENPKARLTNGFALSFYGTTEVGQMIHRSKYGHGGDFPDHLVQAMAELVYHRYQDIAIDLILYIPSTVSGSLLANYAHRLAAALNLPCYNILNKTKATQPQKVFQNMRNKRKNVAGVFALERPYLVRGKTVMLLDDVCDSGATLQEAGNTLITAGAQWVIPLTLAKTVGGA